MTTQQWWVLKVGGENEGGFYVVNRGLGCKDWEKVLVIQLEFRLGGEQCRLETIFSIRFLLFTR